MHVMIMWSTRHNRSVSSRRLSSFKTISHLQRQANVKNLKKMLGSHRLVSHRYMITSWYICHLRVLSNFLTINQCHRDQSTKDNLKAKRMKLAGIRNLGNTCYMNSVLQCLSHIQRFTSSVEEPPGNEVELAPTSNGAVTHKRKLLQLANVNDNSKPEL